MWRYLKTHLSAVQTAATITGVVAGIGLGLALREVKAPWTSREVIYIKFVGDLHLRFLEALIIPIIVSSLVSAMGSLDVGLSRLLCIRTICVLLGHYGGCSCSGYNICGLDQTR